MKIKKIFFCIFIFILFISCASTKKIENEELIVEYFNIANIYSSNRSYDKAIEFYLKCLNHPDYFSAASWSLARTYALLNKWVDAQKYLKPVYEENTKNSFIASAYAFILAKLGYSKESVSLYKEIYFNNLDDPEYGVNYCEILFSTKNYEEALIIVKELKEKFPNDDLFNKFLEIEEKTNLEIENLLEKLNEDYENLNSDLENDINDNELE